MSDEKNTEITRVCGADLVEALSKSRLFRDAPNDSIYIVISGRMRVHLTNAEDEPASYIGVGECAGEMSVIDGDTPRRMSLPMSRRRC